MDCGPERAALLLAGSYEQILFGFQLKAQSWDAEADFTHHAHTASLTAVAVNNRYVATGSKDETIQLYDMTKKVDHGSLLHHDGTITCLEFHGNKHLLSGGEDGLLCVWGTKKWECLKSIRAHKGHVSSLSVHPSGKLALSVGTDKTLRTWNLIDGKSAFIKNIKQNAQIVQWSPSGESYIVVLGKQLDIYSLTTASVSGVIQSQTRVSALKFVTESVIAVAGDEEVVRLYDTNSQKCICEFKAHETRVKALDSFQTPQSHVLATASSDGYIKLWKLDLEKLQNSPLLLGKVSTSARLTCLAVWLSNAGEEPKEESKQCEVAEKAVGNKLPGCKKKLVKCNPAEETEQTEQTKQQTTQKRKKQLKETKKKKRKQ
uniref:p21-activated protein kinase-interacting protein 1-like protein n=1 Tax=Callorhinchus milii TaxID=7868 RepID=V9KNS9_CALMI